MALSNWREVRKHFITVRRGSDFRSVRCPVEGWAPANKATHVKAIMDIINNVSIAKCIYLGRLVAVSDYDTPDMKPGIGGLSLTARYTGTSGGVDGVVASSEVVRFFIPAPDLDNDVHSLESQIFISVIAPNTARFGLDDIKVFIN